MFCLDVSTCLCVKRQISFNVLYKGVKLNLLAKILIMVIGDYILQNANLVVVGQNNTSKVIFSLQLKVSLS